MRAATVLGAVLAAGALMCFLDAAGQSERPAPSEQLMDIALAEHSDELDALRGDSR